jgi:hypothetical protein
MEFNAFARLRGAGVSHVRPATCWEFLRNLLSYRIGNRWKRDLAPECAVEEYTAVKR